MARQSQAETRGQLIVNTPRCMGCGLPRGECGCGEGDGAVDEVVQMLVSNGLAEEVRDRLHEAIVQGGGRGRARVIPDVGGGRRRRDDDDDDAPLHPLFNQYQWEAEARREFEGRREARQAERSGPTFNGRGGRPTEDPDDGDGGPDPYYHHAKLMADSRRQLRRGG